ncbi:hypothetical protein V2J09_005323 [Rumex salicifolius]
MDTSLAIFLCFLPLLIICAKQTTTNITLGSTLTAGDESRSPWLSPSGDFAFGFQRAPGPTEGFLVAIWYNKIPEKTVTWSANRDNLAQRGAQLNLTINGLVLSDSNGNQMWNTTLSMGSRVAYANLLDTGNFVVEDKNDKTLWQSFDYPTDTILPTQIMDKGTQLIARFSDTNYSSGRFKLILQPDDGNFVAYTINWPQQSINYAHYFGTPFSYKIGYRVVFNQSGPIYIIAQKGNNLGNILPNVVFSTQYQYQRAIFEFDGVFRRYVYPISRSANQSLNWIMQDFVPKNICNQTGTQGGGPCGFNSYCQIGADTKPKCSCPPGYSLFDETDYMKGCKRDFIAQSCFTEQQQYHQFELQKMDSTTFRGQDSESFVGMPESDCHESCLNDCLCAAVVVDGNQCWKKGFPLIRFCRRKKKEKVKVQQDIAGTSMINFSYKQLEEATNGFEEVIGQGAFAVVYKGTLDLEQGELFAVKKLHDSVKESQTEFEREVKAIARTGHRNLVQLVGFCNEEQHRLLVYEYMPNGSLADILFRDQRPNWSRRSKFALETARGLSYLHEECSIQIIHCDIKPQNILLDKSFTTRISDFGLAKLMKKDQTHTLTGLRGTKGYVAPEWFRSMPITTKVDVYSYGILLLEIICCRRCYVAGLEDESQIVLADWAFDCCKEGRIDMLVKKYVMVALCCIQEDPYHRPSMNEVVQMIKGEIEEAFPRDLSSYFASLNAGFRDVLSFGSGNSFYNTKRPLMKNDE